jgi:hypothetical protein
MAGGATMVEWRSHLTNGSGAWHSQEPCLHVRSLLSPAHSSIRGVGRAEVRERRCADRHRGEACAHRGEAQSTLNGLEMSRCSMLRTMRRSLQRVER